MFALTDVLEIGLRGLDVPVRWLGSTKVEFFMLTVYFGLGGEHAG
jgi:hypothetical protein